MSQPPRSFLSRPRRRMATVLLGLLGALSITATAAAQTAAAPAPESTAAKEAKERVKEGADCPVDGAIARGADDLLLGCVNKKWVRPGAQPPAQAQAEPQAAPPAAAAAASHTKELSAAAAAPTAPAALDDTTPDDGKIAPIPRENLPRIFHDLLNENDVVVKKFANAGGVPGMNGWIVRPASQPGRVAVFYTLRDDTYLISGSLFTVDQHDGQNGFVRNLTGDYLERYKPVIDYAALWPQIEGSTWFRQGADDAQAKFILYGFIDLNCVYCHLAWLALAPYTQAGLQIRWIPVAVLAPDSLGKAAALLATADPAAALATGQGAWDTKRGQAFPVLAGDIPQLLQEKIQANSTLMRQMGSTGTPTFAFKDAQGQAHMIPGLIRLSDIPEVTGLPAIPNDDPRLADYR